MLPLRRIGQAFSYLLNDSQHPTGLDEFGIQISEKELEHMDGSFDSMVRFLVARLK